MSEKDSKVVFWEGMPLDQTLVQNINAYLEDMEGNSSLDPIEITTAFQSGETLSLPFIDTKASSGFKQGRVANGARFWIGGARTSKVNPCILIAQNEAGQSCEISRNHFAKMNLRDLVDAMEYYLRETNPLFEEDGEPEEEIPEEVLAIMGSW